MSRLWSSINELLEDSREDEELQVTDYADRELAGADPLTLSDGGEKDAPRQEAQEKEDPAGKDSVSKGEELAGKAGASKKEGQRKEESPDGY